MLLLSVRHFRISLTAVQDQTSMLITTYHFSQQQLSIQTDTFKQISSTSSTKIKKSHKQQSELIIFSKLSFSDLCSQSQQTSSFQDKFSKHWKTVIFKDSLLISISSITNAKNKNNIKVSSHYFVQVSRIFILSIIKKQIFK